MDETANPSEDSHSQGFAELPIELEEKIEELEQKVPPEVRREVRHVVEMASYKESFHSPLPPPQILREYEEILPGATDRFLKLAENQAKHRQKMEEKMIGSEIEDQKTERIERKRGQLLGFGIGCITIIIGSIVAAIGQPWAGGFIGCGGVVGLVSVFVLGRKLQESAEPPKDEG